MTDKQSDFHLLDVENCLQLVFQSPQKLSRSKTMGHITTALELGKYAWEDQLAPSRTSRQVRAGRTYIS